MSFVLDRLRRDHIDLSKLLRLLERQAEDLARDGRADLLLVGDALRYLSHYPDLVHHPKEDLIYQQLRVAAPDVADMVAGIVNDHTTIADDTRLLVQQFQEAVDAGCDDPAALAADLGKFVANYWRHMEIEERVLFWRAEAVLEDTDWQAIDDAANSIVDPLFDGAVESQYESLHAAILRLGS